MSNQFADQLIPVAANFGLSLAVKMAKNYAAAIETAGADLTPSQAVEALAQMLEAQIISSQMDLAKKMLPPEIVAQIEALNNGKAAAALAAAGAPSSEAAEQPPAETPVETAGEEQTFDRGGGRNENNEGDLVDNSGGARSSEDKGAEGTDGGESGPHAAIGQGVPAAV